jgi:long-chain acyl-CoA synthetase
VACPTGAWVDDTLIHGRLSHWAQTQGDKIAIDNGISPITFAALWQTVQSTAQDHQHRHSPATVLVGAQPSTQQQLIDFLGAVASGRCAAVCDADWPQAVQNAVAQSFDPQPYVTPPPNGLTPFYVGFTSGSTGLPKGFERHHQSWTESLAICLQTFGPAAAQRVLAPGRVSHSLFLFGMVLGLYSGAGVVVQEKFSATQTLHTLREGLTPCLVAVPSQLLLLLEVASRKGLAPMPAVNLILISGARWMRQRTPELQALFPKARIVEFYGASETSFMAWMDADPHAPAQAVGRPFANVALDIRHPNHEGVGQIYVRSPMLFNRYVGPQTDHTAAIREGDWLSVRDMGYINEQGLLCLVGRENRMVVTQGKNLFPEEVESVLQAHPAVVQVSVQGLPDPLRGQQVVALIQLRTDVQAATLAQWCRERLEAYKIPKRFYTCSHWPMTASGKTDHASLAQQLHAHAPCLTPLS